jgi:hypothetical protein
MVKPVREPKVVIPVVQQMIHRETLRAEARHLSSNRTTNFAFNPKTSNPTVTL